MTNPPSFFFFLKGAKDRFCVFSHSPQTPVNGGGRDSCEERLGRDLGERLWDIFGRDIPGLHSSHLSWEESPSQGKINDLTLWDAAPLPSGVLLATPSEILFALSCTFLVLFSVFLCHGILFCLSFFFFLFSHPVL